MALGTGPETNPTVLTIAMQRSRYAVFIVVAIGLITVMAEVFVWLGLNSLYWGTWWFRLSMAILLLLTSAELVRLLRVLYFQEPICLQIDATGELNLVYSSDSKQDGHLLGAVFLGRYLLILSIREQGLSWSPRKYLILWPDSAEPESLRQLRTFIRWGGRW